MECRASGFIDHEWCLQNDIKPGTFYNWVRRLRQKGYTEISDSISGHAPHSQEIVKIEAECFPAAEAATKVSIAERLAVYPNHFWVQLDGDRMIGFVNGMVTDDPDLRDEMY